MIEKIELSNVMSTFPSTDGVGYIYGENSNSPRRILMNDLSNKVANAINMRKVAVIEHSQVDCRLELSINCTAIVCMIHTGDNSRIPEVAIVTNAYGTYRITTISKTNVGAGILVSEDGSHVLIRGLLSPKRVSAMVISGSGTASLSTIS